MSRKCIQSQIRILEIQTWLQWEKKSGKARHKHTNSDFYIFPFMCACVLNICLYSNQAVLLDANHSFILKICQKSKELKSKKKSLLKLEVEDKKLLIFLRCNWFISFYIFKIILSRRQTGSVAFVMVVADVAAAVAVASMSAVALC